MNWRVAVGALLLICSPAAARSPEMMLASDAAAPAATSGIQKIGSNAYFYRPASASGSPRPLIVLFHGAGMSARNFLDGARAEADRCGCLLLSVQSAGATWDTVGLVSKASKEGPPVNSYLGPIPIGWSRPCPSRFVQRTRIGVRSCSSAFPMGRATR